MRILLLLMMLANAFQPTNSKKLNMDIDAAAFRQDSSKVRWEMYYSLPDTSFTFNKVNGVFIGELSLTLTVTDSRNNGKTYQWPVQYMSKVEVKTMTQMLLGMKSILLEKGKYKAKIDIIDNYDSTTVVSQNFNFTVRDFSNGNLSMSDILLSQYINTVADSTVNLWDSSFVKDNYYILPNPSLEIVSTTPELNTYVEIYGSPNCPDSPVNITYTIFDSQKFQVFKEEKKKKIHQSVCHAIQTLPVEILPSGAYFLEIKSVLDSGTVKDSATVYKKFYLLNPNRPPKETCNFSENVVFEKSEFITMDEATVQREIDQASYIASSFEIETFKELSLLVAKQRALFNFWVTRDPDTTTTFNERRREYKNLIDIANTNFSFGLNNEGWRTDRGEILLQYGQPDQRDRFIAESNKRAYETWYYNQKNGMEFNFVDLQGYGDYTLVNTNVSGLVQNNNWYNQYVQEVDYEGNSVDDGTGSSFKKSNTTNR